jgi:hypothetical protein
LIRYARNDSAFPSLRALFEKKADRIDITIEAEAAEDEIIGTTRDKNGDHLVRYKFTKLADWP